MLLILQGRKRKSQQDFVTFIILRQLPQNSVPQLFNSHKKPI